MTTSDSIRLTGVRAYGYHGVLDFERRDGQEFIVDVEVWLDTRRAAASDDLTATCNYGVLAQRIADVVAGEPFQLIETLAEHLAAVALADPNAREVEITVHKPSAPIAVPFVDVSVRIRRSHLHVPMVEEPLLHRHLDGSGGVEDRSRVEHTGSADALGAIAPRLVPDDVVPFPEGDFASPLLPVPLVAESSEAMASAPTTAMPVELMPVELAPDVVAPGERVPGEPTLVELPSAPQWADNSGVREELLNTVPEEPTAVVLALGGNLGDVVTTLRSAIYELDAIPGMTVQAVGPLARTASVGGPEQPDFHNTVVLGRTTLSPQQLLDAVHAIENAHGRERIVVWGPRTLDIDIITYGDVVAVSEHLEIPHPRAHERAFVLLPWAHLDAEAQLPGLGGGPVGVLAETAADRSGVRALALDWFASDSHPAADHSAPAHASDSSPAVPS